MDKKFRICVLVGLFLALAWAEPASAAPPQPRWMLYTESGAAGQALRYQAVATSDVNLAFRFDWGDGTSTRDPATGFYAPQPNPNVLEVVSAEVTHAWSAAGTYTVRVFTIDATGAETASDPITVTISPSLDETQADCGVQGDAGNTVEMARLITVPGACAGRLEGLNGIDVYDVYSFEVTQRFRLLTIFTSGGVVETGVTLYDPTGARDQNGNLIPEPIPFHYRSGPGGFAWTLNQTGTWKIQVGGDGDYRITLRLGGGGNDCVEGRVPSSIPDPIDAMNNEVSMVVGQFGEFNCAGVLETAARDRYDSYVFDTAPGGELVVLSMLPADEFSRQKLEVMLDPPEFASSTLIGQNEVLSLPGDVSVNLTLRAFTLTTDPDVLYRMRFASTTRRNGDCFTGADAGNTSAAAASLSFACLGELTASDIEDWYRFAALAGDEVHVTKFGPVPLEIYDSDGIKRADNAGSVMIDKTGDWYVRTLTDKPGFAHFEGVYGLEYFLRKGWPDRDCGTGADTGVTGLTVTLPVTCNGDFLPWTFNTTSGEMSDRYNFQLNNGDIVTITVTILSPIADYTAYLDSPAPATVASQHGSRQFTLTHTANQTGQWSVLLERAPLGDPADTRYTISISKQSPPAPPLASLTLNPVSVTGGSPSTGTATLSAAAPVGGTVVTLSSSNPAVAAVPASVRVPDGATSTNFMVTTSAVAASTVVTITGESGGATQTVNLTVNPAPTNTGFRSPVTNSADSGGDGNGFESNPSNAHNDDTLNAADNNSGSGTSTSCTSSSKDKHRFFNYGFSIPGGATIAGIEVRLDARADSASSSPKMCVQLSWDGGTTWTVAKATGTLGTSMNAFTLGSATDTWGRTWTPANFADANFRVRVIDVSSSTSRDFFLDWVGVRVTYAGGGPTPTSPAASPTPTLPAATPTPALPTPTPTSSLTTATPTRTPTPPTDTVNIQVAEYDDRDEDLRVEATSTSASATLQVFVISTNQLIGTLRNDGGGRYSGTFSWPTNPQNITVRSSLGGSATRAVTER